MPRFFFPGMKTDLAIIGQGAVSPAGLGVAALRKSPVPIPIASLGHPHETWPVFRVDQGDSTLQKWQREPRLRRASPLTLFLVEAAAQALQGTTPEMRAQTGIIVAFSAGCLAYSCRFFQGLTTHGQKTASPALFPETVFNSPVSHVVAVHGLNGAAYALVGDETAWITALKTAAVWLQLQRVSQVLVLGGEEFDPLALDAYRSVRWLRKGTTPLPFRASEGAGALLIRSAQPGDQLRITQLRDGFIYRAKKEMRAAAARLTHDLDPKLPFFATARHNILSPIEAQASHGRRVLGGDDPYPGEAFTASAAWNTLRACSSPDFHQELIVPTWGLNHQFGLLQLSR
jgi:hypothetical protein